MTKRRLNYWSLILLTLAAFAVWLEPTRVVWGWLRGDAFYQGRPTSWWRRELERWWYFDVHSFSNGSGRSTRSRWYRAEGFLEQHLPAVFKNNTTEPPLMNGDPAARDMLLEIIRQPYDASNNIRTGPCTECSQRKR